MTEALIASPEPEPEPEPFTPTGIQTRTLNPYPNQALMAPRGERSLERVRVANALLMHARADSFVEPNGSRAFFERAQCPGSKALVLFGGAAAASELCTAGPPTALAELEAIKVRVRARV